MVHVSFGHGHVWIRTEAGMDSITKADLLKAWFRPGAHMGQTCCRSAPGLTHVCPRSESGLEQICFCDGIHACRSPDSDMSMSKRNMHHVWTRSEIGKILRCSDLVSKFFLDRFPLTKTSKRLRGRFKGLKTVLINFFCKQGKKTSCLKDLLKCFIFNILTKTLARCWRTRKWTT